MASITRARRQPGVSRRYAQAGAFAVIFAMLSMVLLFFVGLGMDIGRLYVSRSELQNAADSCALAGSQALTGSASNQLNVSEAWAIRAGTLNRIGMQAGPPAIVANSQVTFSETLNGTYATKNNIAVADVPNMKFVRCTLQEANIGSILIKVANGITAGSVTPSTIGATAVASLAPSISACAVPLAMCATGAVAPYGFNLGDWKQGKFDPGSGLTGAFKWVNFPGYTNVPDMKAMMEGKGSCTVNGGTTVNSQNGSIASLIDPWNNHFGLYKGAQLDSMPDYTGHSYDLTSWPAGSNAFADFVQKRGLNSPPPSIGNGWKDNGWATAVKGDRRLVVAPIIDCTGLAGGANVPIKDWACMLMLNAVSNVNDTMYLEFRGFAGSGAPCGVVGAPGGTGASGPRVPSLVQ